MKTFFTFRRFFGLGIILFIFASSLLGQRALDPTLENVVYGPHKRNVLDFWSAQTSEPSGVLIYMHGGGFIHGDKNNVRTDPILRKSLEKGISVISINYRYVSQAPYPAPMLDGKRALQFVRSKAREWNLNPQKVALMGYSAGALISLWIGLRNDMAEPSHEDPVLRESTRVQVVIPKQAPTSSDPIWIWENIGGSKSVYPSLLMFYGIDSLEDVYLPRIRLLAYEASPINFVSRDDPPVGMYYHGKLTETPLAPNTPTSVSIHHPQFGILLKKELIKEGIVSHVFYRGGEKKIPIVDFVSECFDGRRN